VSKEIYQFVAGLIPRNLQLESKVMLPSLGWCHQSRERAKLCGLGECISTAKAVDVPVFFCYVAAAIMW